MPGSPWVQIHLLKASPPHPREGGKWREGTRRRASLYGRLGVETTKRSYSGGGNVARRAAERRKAPSSNGFDRDREMVPQPRGHVQPGPRAPHDRSLRWLGPAGSGRDAAPTASQCQAARGQPSSSSPPAHLTVLFPRPPRRSLPALAAAEKGNLSPPATCPPASGARGARSSRLRPCSSLQEPLGAGGLFPCILF